MNYICDEFILGLNSTMVGSCGATKDQKSTGMKLAMADRGNVAEELKSFGKECKFVDNYLCSS